MSSKSGFLATIITASVSAGLLFTTVLLAVTVGGNRKLYFSLLYDACSPNRYYNRYNMDELSRVIPGEFLNKNQMAAIDFHSDGRDGLMGASSDFGYLILITHLEQRYLVTDICNAMNELKAYAAKKPNLCIILSSNVDKAVSNLVVTALRESLCVDIRLTGAGEFIKDPPKPFSVLVVVAPNGRIEEVQQAATPCVLRDILKSIPRLGGLE